MNLSATPGPICDRKRFQNEDKRMVARVYELEQRATQIPIRVRPQDLADRTASQANLPFGRHQHDHVRDVLHECVQVLAGAHRRGTATVTATARSRGHARSA